MIQIGIGSYKLIVPKLPSNWCKFLELILSLFYSFCLCFVGGFYGCFDFVCLFLEFGVRWFFLGGETFHFFNMKKSDFYTYKLTKDLNCFPSGFFGFKKKSRFENKIK